MKCLQPDQGDKDTEEGKLGSGRLGQPGRSTEELDYQDEESYLRASGGNDGGNPQTPRAALEGRIEKSERTVGEEELITEVQMLMSGLTECPTPGGVESVGGAENSASRQRCGDRQDDEYPDCGYQGTPADISLGSMDPAVQCLVRRPFWSPTLASGGLYHWRILAQNAGPSGDGSVLGISSLANRL